MPKLGPSLLRFRRPLVGLKSLNVQTKAKDRDADCQWVMMGGHPNPETGAQHEGGSPICISGAGTIEKGPKKLKGTKVKPKGEKKEKIKPTKIKPTKLKRDKLKGNKIKPDETKPQDEQKKEQQEGQEHKHNPYSKEYRRALVEESDRLRKEIIDAGDVETIERLRKRRGEIHKILVHHRMKLGTVEGLKKTIESNQNADRVWKEVRSQVNDAEIDELDQLEKEATEKTSLYYRLNREKRTEEAEKVRESISADQDKRSKLQEALRQKFHKFLMVSPEERSSFRPVGIDKTKPSTTVKLRDAARWLSDHTAASDHLTKSIEYTVEVLGFGRRAYYSPGQDRIHVTDYDDIGTIIHEIAHHIEYTNPGVSKASQAFLQDRVGDEKPRKMSEITGFWEYGNELGRRDDFEKTFGNNGAYVGKIYSNPSTTEVISMGIEMMYNNPGKFARSDPEYFKLIVSVMDGTIR